MRTLILFCTLLFSNLCAAQDVITFISGELISARVLEVTATEVRYTEFEHLEGPTFVKLKSSILIIEYEGGTKQIFNEISAYVVEEEKGREEYRTEMDITKNMFILGIADADNHYRGYKGAATSTLVISLLSPLVGLIPAIACASTPPKELNLGYQDIQLMKNKNYSNGYFQEARRIKRNKVWGNWGIALGVNLVLVLAITSGS